ncbi:tail fiber protein [Xenorhabdus sp. PB30.3]|uniref:phage tail fiber protein n=1 Tax=Xenorhabdus sp. PB30.3 TaxID=2788941 RepID=UPI001E4E537E|nr:phage tail protein [Xenorhabdus sp. PB30.3]
MQDKKPDVPVSDESNLVIVTTPEYVKEAIAEHAASRNHPDATLQDKGFVVLSNDVSDSETMAATPKAVKEAYDLASTANNNIDTRLAKDQNGSDIPDKAKFVKNIGAATQEWVTNNGSGFIKGCLINPATSNEFTSWITSLPPGGHAFRFQANNAGTGYSWSCGYITRMGDTWAGFVSAYNDYGVAIIHGNDGGGNTKVSHLWTDKNATVVNGYLKAVSPTIFIHPNGKFTSNDESVSITAEHLSKGTYLIKGVKGFSNDGAVSSIDIPRCQNDLPMVWVNHEVLPDGSIKLMTYHREHSDAPAFARNIREGYADGDLIDIPDGRFVSVRVQMPDTK